MKGSLYKEFQDSSELAQKLLLDAFKENEVTSKRQKIELPTEKKLKDDANVNEIRSVELTRDIMKKAGFSDLFSPNDDGSFERILKIGEDNNDLTENKDMSKKEDGEHQTNNRPVSTQSSQTQSLTSDNTSASRASESVDPISSTSLQNLQPLSLETCTDKDDNDEKASSVVGGLISPKANSEISFITCITSPQPICLDDSSNLKTVKKSNKDDTKMKEEELIDSSSPLKKLTQKMENTSLNEDQQNEEKEFDDIQYTIPRSFSMVSCNSHSTNGFSIKSSKSIDDVRAEFEIEESISFTVNELNRINSMLEDAESSCHSSRASDDRDALFFAKQTKQEIAALAKAIEKKVKAEQNNSFANAQTQVSYSYTEDSGDSPRRIRRVGSPLKQDRMAKSPAMDRLIEDVNELCNQIEGRIDNIVSDTQT